MNSFQITYALALLVLTVPAWRREGYVLACLWANLLVTLLICLAMDLGLDGGISRLGMMTTDLTTGVVLAMRPGLARVIAAGYALTVPLYVPLIRGVFTRGDADFTVIYIVAAFQIGALAIGALGGGSGDGGGRVRRLASGRLFVGQASRGGRVSGGAISAATLQGQEMK